MDFEQIIDERCNKIKEVLAKKGTEYTPAGNNRFHSFIKAANKQGITPEKALMGMKAKHTVCIDDLVDLSAHSPGKLDIDVIDEKIGDEINYLILLEGLLKTRAQLGASNSWPEIEFGAGDTAKKTKDNDELFVILAHKNRLLTEALEQLLACEWTVSLSTIAKIEKELGIEG